MYMTTSNGSILINRRAQVLTLSGSRSKVESESESHSIVSNSLRPHTLYRPWNSPGQNTGMDSPSLLQGIVPTQGSNPDVQRCRQDSLWAEPQGKPGPRSKSLPNVTWFLLLLGLLVKIILLLIFGSWLFNLLIYLPSLFLLRTQQTPRQENSDTEILVTLQSGPYWNNNTLGPLNKTRWELCDPN